MAEALFGRMANPNTRASAARQRVQGIQHHRRLTPGSPAPGESPRITVTVGPGIPVDDMVCIITEPEVVVMPMVKARPEWDLLSWGYVGEWVVNLPPFTAGSIVRYQIRATDRDSGDYLWADDGETYSYIVGDSGPPAWAQPAIIYQVFPDRFHPGQGREWNATKHLSDIYGGTLRGVIDHLDYIANLGFTVIWLNPFFPDATHHGYHATDYFTVNPRLGTMDDVRELVDKAHARGVRLLLDFVGNHWGSNHPTFQDALTNPDSPYKDWYFWRSYPDDYVAYFDVSDLPKVNVDHPAARDYLLRSVAFWLGDVGFDGLRLDHADGPSTDFWTDVRAVARSVRPDAWMFGEVVRPPDQQLAYSGLFDGTLDFVLGQALRNTFGAGTMTLAEFDALLERHEAFFPSTFNRPSFLDNHDMDRFLLLAGGDKRKLKLAALCQFTLGGPPIVYNGTEVGVEQTISMHEPGSQGMEECRQPMLWGDDQDDDLYAYFYYLIQLRRAHPVLWRGQRRTVFLDSSKGVYVYLREDNTERMLVGLNLSEKQRDVAIFDDATGITHFFQLPPWSGDISLA
ncbi:MAG: alpha-amylase family glycosyl hydrolase [Chloroflexota bacterium]